MRGNDRWRPFYNLRRLVRSDFSFVVTWVIVLEFVTVNIFCRLLRSNPTIFVCYRPKSQIGNARLCSATK